MKVRVRPANGCRKSKAGSMRRQNVGIALLLAAITAIAGLITALCGTATGTDDSGLCIVTTVHPLYTAVQNLTDGVSGIEVQSLAGSANGCMHDYQLSPADRLLLARADLIVLNGAGAESFLQDVLPQLDARAVDTAEGIDVLCGHDHTEDADGDDHDEHAHGHSHAQNEHIWTSPARYAKQVRAAAHALSEADPQHAARYEENLQRYLAKIRETEQRLQAAADGLRGQSCVLFQQSLCYLAADLGLQTVVSLSAGEEGGISAANLAAAEQAARTDPSVLLLYDSQYTLRYPGVDRLVAADRVLALDTAVRGDGTADDWLQAMARTAELLERVGEGQR